MDAITELSNLSLKYNTLRNEARDKNDLVTADMNLYKRDAVDEAIDAIRNIINKGIEDNNG
jgi:hypothetical protein